MVNTITKPWLLLPPQLAHDLSPLFLSLYGQLFSPKTLQWKSISWEGMNFSNPLGIAGGVDKNAESILAWWSLGAGFVEVGTITPKAQGPNPGTILMRETKRQILWNKMGFPNKGCEYAKEKLNQLKRPFHTPIFINVGKNRETPNENAAKDYVHTMNALEEFADAFVINISSPNTKGLRELLLPQNINSFLSSIAKSYLGSKPLILKLSPDIENDEVKTAIDCARDNGINGFILTNTTADRSSTPKFPVEGGISGSPLADKAKNLLEVAANHLNNGSSKTLLVSTGGILTENDIQERLNMGANLLQVYSALIFKGPFFFRNVADKMKSIH